MKIAVVGNRDYKNPDFVFEYLDALYSIFRHCKEFIIVSGEAPNKKGTDGSGNVDQLAKKWAKMMGSLYGNVGYIPFPPKAYTDEEFKKRNKQIAEEVNFTSAFINRGQYHSGTWNTINWLTKKAQFNSFVIFNEYKQEWSTEIYPKWLKQRIGLYE